MATAAPLDLDPVLAACKRAPVVRRLTPEQRAELDRAVEDIRAGRSRVVAADGVPEALEEIALANLGDTPRPPAGRV
jgi:hypothetical protein